MSTDAVELLERAIGYTRGTLLAASTTDLTLPTPCSEWNLGELLEHMSDGLDAFTEASTGLIGPYPIPVSEPTPVGVLFDKACALLGAWTSPAAVVVRLGDRGLAGDTVLHTAALEIAVHGWDVARSTRRTTPIPDGLAADLLLPAYALVDASDRGSRFAPCVTVGDGSTAATRLLGFLGRDDAITGVSGGPIRPGRRTPFG
ncbi:TIGR03086 family metal-binding protein [Nocardioides jensenii]|uniref:TIGR03086 family metal-binding protein n=1 Tax=Nocardioides jensenii TaxID=1843 RepID=UPI000836317D|nr:TIGR03086 family metal-binding protein [Nocardioides jensenii]